MNLHKFYETETLFKIRDWTDGKERNIRALLGSLNDVLWEGAEKWQQPRMADLLSAVQVSFYLVRCVINFLCFVISLLYISSHCLKWIQIYVLTVQDKAIV